MYECDTGKMDVKQGEEYQSTYIRTRIHMFIYTYIKSNLNKTLTLPPLKNSYETQLK